VLDRVRASLAVDLKHGLRALRRSLGFAVSVVVTIALGTIVATAVSSVARLVLFRPLPYVSPEQLISVVNLSRKGSVAEGTTISSTAFLDWRERVQSIDAAAYVVGQTTLMHRNGEQVLLTNASVTHDFFPVLGVNSAVRGRLFDAADDRPGATPVTVLSHALWQRRFGGSDIVGATLLLNGRHHVVAGIAPAAFRFPGVIEADLFAPLTLPRDGVVRYINVIARMRDDWPIDRVERELQTVGADASPAPPAEASVPSVRPLQRHLMGDFRGTAVAMIGAVLLVLLLVCSNVTGLLLVRSADRSHEARVRVALGASPAQLCQWLLVEAFLLATAALLVSMLAVSWLLQLLRRLLAGTIVHAESLVIDPWVIGFAVAAALVVVSLALVVPLARIAKVRLNDGVTFALAGRPTRDRVRGVLVAAQVAIAVTLLAGALLLTSTVRNLTGAGLGFEPEHLLTFKLSALNLRSSAPERAAMLDAVLDRLRGVPGVTAVAATSALPLGGHTFGFAVPIEGGVTPAANEPLTAVDVCSEGLFHTLGIKLLAGREFIHSDSARTPAVAVVNAAFAQKHFGDRNPVGTRLSLGGRSRDANITIVGVVENVRSGHPGEPAQAAVYRPFSQAAPQLGWHTATIAIRTPGDPLVVAETARRAVAAAAPAVTVFDVATMVDRLAIKVAPERHRADLFRVLATAAVLLSGVAVFGLVSFSVTQATREFGIRVALGSTATQLVRLAVGKGMVWALTGTAAGLVAAWPLARGLRGMLYGVAETDPTSFFIAAVAVAVMAIAASYVAARRVVAIDPAAILRDAD